MEETKNEYEKVVEAYHGFVKLINSRFDVIEPLIRQRGYDTSRVTFYDLREAINHPFGPAAQPGETTKFPVTVNLVIKKEGEKVGYMGGAHIKNSGESGLITIMEDENELKEKREVRLSIANNLMQDFGLQPLTNLERQTFIQYPHFRIKRNLSFERS